LLGFGGADGDQPGRRDGFGGDGFLEIGLGQNRLLRVSYYSEAKAEWVRPNKGAGRDGK
jgi:hypothetical protein